MKTTLIALGTVAMLAAACGGTRATAKDPAAELRQLTVLYQQARAKFVVQKQEMIQAEDCDRATRLRQAADDAAAEAAMSPENTQTVTLMQMELQQAEKECLAK